VFFFNHGDGVAGGVGTVTNYLTADEDGAWVGLERFPHPTDSQYSWVRRLAEMFNARTKNFCRHDSCIESILAGVTASADLFPRDPKTHFIGLPTWTKRIFPIYGSWGNSKYYQFSEVYELWGEECAMDGTDFDFEKGKQVIIDALLTGGIKPKDTTYTDYNDQRFYRFAYEKSNFVFQPNLFHPDNTTHLDIIDQWLKVQKENYDTFCNQIKVETGESRFTHLPKAFKTFFETVASHPNDKFYIYGSEDMVVQNVIEKLLNDWGMGDPGQFKNLYWFWGLSMNHYFEGMKIPPRWNGYYAKELHFEFMRHMNKKLTELDKML